LTTARRFNEEERSDVTTMRKIEAITIPRGIVIVVAQTGLTVGEGYRDIRAGDLTQVANFFRGFEGDWDTYDPFSEVSNPMNGDDDLYPEALALSDTEPESNNDEEDIEPSAEDGATFSNPWALTRTQSHIHDDPGIGPSTHDHDGDVVMTTDEDNSPFPGATVPSEEDGHNVNQQGVQPAGAENLIPHNLSIGEALNALRVYNGTQTQEYETALRERVQGEPNLMVQHLRRRSKEEGWDT